MWYTKRKFSPRLEQFYLAMRKPNKANSHTTCTVTQRYQNVTFITQPHLVLFYYLKIFLLWPHHMACGILVPQPGIKPVSSAVRVQSPNHGTTGEFPLLVLALHALWW